MVMLDTFRALHEHDHKFACYCPTCERWALLDLEDQLRQCERMAELQHGFAVVARFTDAAISGGTTARPGYQRMLAAPRRREFDIIVAEDASRLSALES